MKRSPLLPGLTLAIVVALAAVAPGCGRHGEGERCSSLNGNEDCETGLFCRDVAGQSSDVCCPGDDSLISDPRCVANTGTGGQGGAGGGTGGDGTTTTTTPGTGGTGGTGGGTGGTTTGGTGGTGGATTGGSGAGGM